MSTRGHPGRWFKFGRALALWTCAASTAAAQSPSLPELPSTVTRKPKGVADEAEKAVNARIIAQGAALVPGRTTTIGVNFDLAPGWNLYWRNPGDSGLPISVKFETVEGVTLGEAQWPTPERLVLPGDLLDYAYLRRATLLFPLTLSDDRSRIGQTIALRAKVKWLVCKEACVPGEREIELKIPIAETSTVSPDADLIEAARVRIPLTQAEQPSPMISLAWKGRSLELACSAAEELVFFPYEGDAQPEDVLTSGRSTRDALALSYESAGAGAPVRGVLQVKRLGRFTYHLIEAPPVPPVSTSP